MKTKMLIAKARMAGVPLVAVETPDPAATLQMVVSVANGKAAVYRWDCVAGLAAANEAAVRELSRITLDAPPNTMTSPVEMLVAARAIATTGGTPPILVMFGAPYWLHQEPVRQALWNLRDPLKAVGAQVVLFGDAVRVPPELRDDILVLRHPLPTREELAVLVERVVADAKAAGANVQLTPELSTRVVDILSGLSAFAAEQQLAVSIERSGIDLAALWERKIATIQQTPGLTVWRGRERFDDIGGCAAIKRFLGALMCGNDAPRAVVLLDEIEKSLAGATGGDTTGVSQDQLGCLLRYMQDNETPGIIEIGPPGAAKTAVVKAMGAEFDVPVLMMDLGAAKGRYVGDSEQAVRRMLDVAHAVSGGKILWVATCNSITSLPPELRRRFNLGTWFFDLPIAEERRAIWEIYLRRWSLTGPLPPDEGWTGAEIKACCEKAWRLRCSIMEAAETVIPVAVSAAAQIERLRQECSGRYLSANHGGIFTVSQQAVLPDPMRRRMSID